MKFSKLAFYNFGPYKDEQFIEFPGDSSQNVMVVFGDNMRGKTSVLNSLRWVFYGKALNRYGNEIDKIDLLNYEAAKDGNYRMWVSLTFAHDGSEYELRREMNPLPMVYHPKSNGDFTITRLLKRNGQLVNGDEVEFYIEQFLPEEISRFYLFDGELLQEYEMLVMEENEQGKRIRESIEQVLGVPALINARNDVRSLLKKAQQAQAQELKNEKLHEAQANQSLQLTAEIEVLEKDLETANHNLERIKNSIKDLDDKLNNWSEIQQILADISFLKSRRNALSQEEEELNREQLDILKGSWRDLLQPRLQLKRQELLTQMKSSRSRIMEVGAIQNDIHKYISVIKTDTCPVCEQTVTIDHKHSIEEKLENLQKTLELVQQDNDVIGELSEDITKIERISGTNSINRLLKIRDKLKKISIDLTKVESDLKDKEDEIRDHKVSQIADTKSTRDRFVKAQAQAETKISEINKTLSDNQSKLNHLSILLGSGTGTKSSATRQVEIYRDLDEIYSKSIEVLRESLRTTIETEATLAFKELTTEETYAGLKINDSYGLTILDQYNQPVSIRSAGAEQIVAMSLLSALNKAANRIGPIVIDTPFGRLDPRHRQNILRYIPGMAEQIVFLVHAGELDPETGLIDIADKVGKRYEIERVSSSHSRIRGVVG